MVKLKKILLIKKEFLKMVSLGKGKTQVYAFIDNAQSLAKDIYQKNYS